MSEAELRQRVGELETALREIPRIHGSKERATDKLILICRAAKKGLRL